MGGGTVQVIPHITNEIKSRFYRNPSAENTEIAIIEVGGTVGDIESQPFLESIRQFQHEKGRDQRPHLLQRQGQSIPRQLKQTPPRLKTARGRLWFEEKTVS